MSYLPYSPSYSPFSSGITPSTEGPRESSYSSLAGAFGPAPSPAPSRPQFMVRWKLSRQVEELSEDTERRIRELAHQWIVQDGPHGHWRCADTQRCEYSDKRPSECLRHAITHLVSWVCGACSREYTEKRTLISHKCR